MRDRERPPLVMAYWLLLAVYLFVLASDAVAANVEPVLDFAVCMPAALCTVPAAIAGAAAVATETAADGLCGPDDHR